MVIHFLESLIGCRTVSKTRRDVRFKHKSGLTLAALDLASLGVYGAALPEMVLVFGGVLPAPLGR